MCSTVILVPTMTGFPNITFGSDLMRGCEEVMAALVCLSCRLDEPITSVLHCSTHLPVTGSAELEQAAGQQQDFYARKGRTSWRSGWERGGEVQELLLLNAQLRARGDMTRVPGFAGTMGAGVGGQAAPTVVRPGTPFCPN